MRFLGVEQVLDIHDAILAATGIGLPGVKDLDLLSAGVLRAEMKAHYEPGTDIATLAAAVCFGIAFAHAFNDGNKRTAIFCCELFLGLNGWELEASDEDLLDLTIALVERRLDEKGLAEELRRWIVAADTANSP